jgi:hypothetical protein
MATRPVLCDEPILTLSREDESAVHDVMALALEFKADLCVSGSVARHRSGASSDIDLIMFPQDQATFRSLVCMMAPGVAAPESFVTVAIAHRSEIKTVSVRIMQPPAAALFLRNEPQEIWKSHSILQDRSTPELLIGMDGSVHLRNWLESRHSGGYVYSLCRYLEDGTPVLNTENTLVFLARQLWASRRSVPQLRSIQRAIDDAIGPGLDNVMDTLRSLRLA